MLNTCFLIREKVGMYQSGDNDEKIISVIFAAMQYPPYTATPILKDGEQYQKITTLE